MPTPVEIQPPRMGIDLYGHPVPCAGAQYRFDIDVIARTAHQLTSGHMAQDRGAWVRDRAEQAGGLLFLFQLEATMNTRDDEIEPTKNFVGVVEGAVGQDIGLDALEDPEFLAKALVEPVGFLVLRVDLLRRESSRRNALTCE